MKEIAIQVNDLSKTYGNHKKKKLLALNQLSFSVDKASCYGLLGPNGAGKTTCMKVLYGINRRDPDPATVISVFGYDPHKSSLKIKNLSGIVPQEDNLDQELNILQNLSVYARFYGLNPKQSVSTIESLLEFMELSEYKQSKIRELSGGMKRRLMIARALINSPKLLFLDEPTTGLDPQVRHLIWDKLRLLKQDGVTIMLTTHYMEEAFQICDQISIMDKGKKILEGPPAELISKNIEAYVLEIYDQLANSDIKINNDIRQEHTGSRLLCYSDNINSLRSITSGFEAGSFFLRQSNLEDIFLKTTGRQIHEG